MTSSRKITEDEPLDQLASGFRKRTLKTVKLLARSGLSMARRNLRGGPRAPAESDDDGKALAAAERLLRELDGLKGLVMKFGQMASYLDHSLPPQARRVLARLQSESRAMAYHVVAARVKSELGDEPEAIFDSFEREPFAAASIGQVHRARWRGRDVAVKVQYPGIVRALDSDLKLVSRFARVGFMLSALDGNALAAELRDRILEECDYSQEARNQTLFHQFFAGDPHRSVPEVIAAASSAGVLTSSFAGGERFQAFVDRAPQQARDRAGEIIFETCMGCIFRHAVFNADPHPGNYLFDDSGNVTFLDFGCIKWFSTDFIDRWKALARSIVNDDRAAFPDRFIETGMIAKTKNFDWDFQWRAMNHLYAPFKAREPTVYTGEFIEKAHDLIAFSNPNKFKMTLPRDWLFVNRLQFGLLSVLALLGARGDWGRLFRAAIESETRPLTPIAP